MSNSQGKSERRLALISGRKRYSTGKPCRHGHICERYTSSGGCVVCTNLENRLSAKKNREKYKARLSSYGKYWYQKNRERILLKSKTEWRKAWLCRSNALSNSYVRSLLTSNGSNLLAKDVPQELIDAKRIQIQILREVAKHEKCRRTT